MQKNLRHDDCRNFIPIDVAKGFCFLTQQTVLIDSDTCEKLADLPKCKICSNFKNPDDKLVGTCEGFKDGFWTYGDLRASNCEKYQTK